MNGTTTVTDQTEGDKSPHWVSRTAFQFVAIALFVSQGSLAWAVYHDRMWLAALLVLTTSHFMHGALVGFHEASHGLLRKNRKLNEFDGVFIGMLSILPFSLYRAAHQSHHAHLSTERDEELWPFVDPAVPRAGRVLAAVLELTCGLFFTPYLFLRAFIRRGSRIRNKKVRRRVWAEYGLSVAFWTTVLVIVAHFNAWKFFLWVQLAPAFIAANLQSWRKYIEHVGMTGSTINSCTRSIVADGLIGRLVSFTLLHEPYHGVHHRHSGLPHAELPSRRAVLAPASPEERPPFRSYAHALVDLARNLSDPKVGAQWNRQRRSTDQVKELQSAV